MFSDKDATFSNVLYSCGVAAKQRRIEGAKEGSIEGANYLSSEIRIG